MNEQTERNPFLSKKILLLYLLSMKIKILVYVDIDQTLSLTCLFMGSFVRTGGFMSALRIFQVKTYFKVR